jgi:predicted RNA binding protein YcfA (HicA-like mRNA interferase family)
MPKFPGFSGAEIVRALEKLGFVVARQSGTRAFSFYTQQLVALRASG